MRIWARALFALAVTSLPCCDKPCYKRSLHSPGTKDCDCGCFSAWKPAAQNHIVPTYAPPWWAAPCPPWGCACRFGICVPGVTHGNPNFGPIYPIPEPGIPALPVATHAPLPAQPTTPPAPCPYPDEWKEGDPWYCKPPNFPEPAAMASIIISSHPLISAHGKAA